MVRNEFINLLLLYIKFVFGMCSVSYIAAIFAVVVSLAGLEVEYVAR